MATGGKDPSIEKKGLLRSESVLMALLILLSVATAGMLFRLYQTSSLLAESYGKTFVLDTKSKAATLEEYFRQRKREVAEVCTLKVFSDYYAAQALGMLPAHGREILSSPIEQALLVRRLSIEEQGRPVYLAAAYYDFRAGKILARTDFSAKGKWINEALFQWIAKKKPENVHVGALCDGQVARIFLRGVVNYEGERKGLLLMELSPDSVLGEIQLPNLQRIDDFTGLVGDDGTLFVGPPAFIGMKVQNLLNIAPEALPDLSTKQVKVRFAEGKAVPGIAASGKIADTQFHILQVVPPFQHGVGHSPFLWTMVFVSLMGGLVLVVVHMSRSHRERNLMFRQLSEAHDHLEARVEERTAELNRLNETLLLEANVRRRAEEALRKAGQELEMRVLQRTKELVDANERLMEEVVQREKIEVALRESTDRFRGLTETTSEWIWEVDRHLRFTYASPRLVELLGYAPEKVLGKTPFDLMAPEEARIMVKEFETIIASQRPFKDLENLYLHEDGRTIILESSGLPFSDGEGRLSGYRGISRDVTHRKRAEELLIQSERLKAVAELSAGVAHNFNNLLQIVLSNAEVAAHGARTGDMSAVESNLAHILESCRFGAETVRRLQDFARGRTDLAARDGHVFSLSRTVQRAIEMTETWWKTAPEREGLRITLKSSLAENAFVKGEENELFEVVVNLIKNSAEALPLGGNIDVKVYSHNGSAILQVADDGVGIQDQDLGRVFHPFFTTKGLSGTGMGLASSYGIIHRHGGDISVESEAGHGATFTIALPLAGKGADSKEVVAVESDTPLRILLVDDQALVTAAMRLLFENDNHTVFTALSAAEGLEIFHKEPLDLIISDLSMPAITGWQMAEAVKKESQERGIRRPLFMVLTGWSMDVAEDKRLDELGVDHILEKPVIFNRLTALIRKLVRERNTSS